MNHRVACAAALAVIVLAGAPAFAVENKDVRVVNTPAEAIPVNATGTVALAQGTQVGVAGPVSLTPDTQVSLTPGTQVGVANTAANPLHVVAAAAVPDVFVRRVGIQILEDAGVGQALIEVPEGKRLVIEQVAAMMTAPLGMTVDFDIEVRSSAAPFAVFRYPTERRDTFGDELLANYIFNEPLRAYHDGDQAPLRVVEAHRGPLLFVQGTVTVSGYLIDLP